MGVKQSHEPCAGKHRIIMTRRNHYFTGKYLTACDFQNEQNYFLYRHWLHNRLLHGWGIVCGLSVLDRHPDPECRKTGWVIVKAGIAMDCLGRELILEADTPIQLPLAKTPPETSAEQSPEQWRERHHHHEPASDQTPIRGPFLVCLRYEEQAAEKVPVLFAEDACSPVEEETNYICENVEVVFRPLDQVDEGCWRVPQTGPDIKCRDDCDHTIPGPAGGCLIPDCPCDGYVPLALIYPKDAEGHPASDPQATYDLGFGIDLGGRRQLPPPEAALTHIAWISWPHGGEVSLSQLREWQGELKVRFDRRLKEMELDRRGCAIDKRTGINENTFTAAYLQASGNLELAIDPDHPPRMGRQHWEEHGPGAEEHDFSAEGKAHEVDWCVAVLKIREDLLKGKIRIAGSIVYVTLKCDFIIDCRELPVDGNHIGGRQPTGNGTPGGTFESWFYVTEDRAEEKSS